MRGSIFSYGVMIFFGVIGLWAFAYGAVGFFLYHKKVEAAGKNGSKEKRSRSSRSQREAKINRAVFTYETDGKRYGANAVNLLGEDNLRIKDGETYTIKVSPFDPHKCYLPVLQLYRGCGLIEAIYYFIRGAAVRLTGMIFIAIALYTYTEFIR